jgi:hypothetical protein
MKTRITLLIISWLLLAAHFSRAGQTILMIFSLIVPLLLFIRKKWALRAVQILTAAGAVVWIDTTWQLIRVRMDMEQDYIRMAVILLTVALFTLVSALLAGTGKMKARYSGK